MNQDAEELSIASRDHWFKVVDMLQQNWALIDPAKEGGVVIWFISDASGVFDQLRCASDADARIALSRNGFRRLADDVIAQEFVHPPEPPYQLRPHPSGPIYSSGKYGSDT